MNVRRSAKVPPLYYLVSRERFIALVKEGLSDKTIAVRFDSGPQQVHALRAYFHLPLTNTEEDDDE